MIEFHIQQFTLAQADEGILQKLPTGMQAYRVIFDIPTQASDIIEVVFEIPGTAASAIEILHTLLGKPITTLTVPLSSSILSNHGPATSNLLEHVFNWFPVSKLTPEFQQQRESDYAKFDSFLKESSERDSMVTSWSSEFDHPDLGEKARAFVVLAGWQRGEMFHEQLQKDNFKEAIPILYAWKAPYRLWLSQRIEF